MPMEYKVVTARIGGNDPDRAAAALTTAVEEMMGAGWKPIGGLAVVPRGDGSPFLVLLQSMVKE